MRLVALLLLLVPLCAGAAPPIPIQITIPPGFTGPVVHPLQAGLYAEVYERPRPGVDHGVTLQVSTYDFGSALAGLPARHAGAVADRYVLEFLEGVRRRRTTFEAAAPLRLSIGGLPASKVTWKGMAGDIATSGAMYCVVVGPMVVMFQTQTMEGLPAEDWQDAMAAIEGASFPDTPVPVQGAAQ